jgi:CrcB protein
VPETGPLTIGRGVLAAAAGGALGSVLRLLLLSWPATPAGGFPWTMMGINILGSGLLAALTLLPAVRRVPWRTVFLGTGVLGGFTAMSAASADTRALLDAGSYLSAAAYALGTLGGALLVVALVLRSGRTP